MNPYGFFYDPFYNKYNIIFSSAIKTNVPPRLDSAPHCRACLEEKKIIIKLKSTTVSCHARDISFIKHFNTSQYIYYRLSSAYTYPPVQIYTRIAKINFVAGPKI